jgi:lipoprotein-releasing system permease protein
LRPLELFVAARYARSHEAGLFVSFITWVSLGGVALGVAALITILSVMNGFEGELRDRLLTLSTHAVIERRDGGAITEVGAVLARLRAMPGVAGAAPFVGAQALLSHASEMSGATLEGVDPASEPAISGIARVLASGTLAELAPGAHRLLLGRALAFQLGVGSGDELTVMIPAGSPDGDLNPKIRAFTVAGVFEVGLQDHDSVLAIANIDDVADLKEVAGPTAVRLRYRDVYAAPRLTATAVSLLGQGYAGRDWTVENAGYFRAIRIEKTMMTLILLLVVAVAAFNIVATLVMVVRAKRTDIAILRTLGLEARGVVGIFLLQGALIGWLGTMLGVVTGVSLALHVDTVTDFLQRLLHFRIFDADVYYLTRIPSVVEPRDVVLVTVTALSLTLLAAVYPSRTAALTEPAEALRYE